MEDMTVMRDDMILKRAKVEITKLNIDSTGNAHTVRIIPDMDGIAPESTIYLPRYGSFFSESPRTYSSGDIVWVLCSTDYQVGYILGLAGTVGGSLIYSVLDRINSNEEKLEIPLSTIHTADITCVTDQFIDYSNKKYGHSGRLTKAGACNIFTSDGSVYLSSKSGAVIKLLADGGIQQTATDITTTAKSVVETSASHTLSTQGYIEEVAGSKKEQIGVSLSQSIGGDVARTVAGDENNLTFKKKTETAGLGYTIQVVLPLGSIDLNALLGGINLNSIFLNAPLGFASPFAGPGPFCTIPFCLLTGIPHTGRKFTGIPLP
jgi:hypothetical protein